MYTDANLQHDKHTFNLFPIYTLFSYLYHFNTICPCSVLKPCPSDCDLSTLPMSIIVPFEHTGIFPIALACSEILRSVHGVDIMSTCLLECMLNTTLACRLDFIFFQKSMYINNKRWLQTILLPEIVCELIESVGIRSLNHTVKLIPDVAQWNLIRVGEYSIKKPKDMRLMRGWNYDIPVAGNWLVAWNTTMRYLRRRNGMYIRTIDNTSIEGNPMGLADADQPRVNHVVSEEEVACNVTYPSFTTNEWIDIVISSCRSVNARRDREVRCDC